MHDHNTIQLEKIYLFKWWRKGDFMAKEKKIYFSEEIDSRINGYALALAFVVCGLILQFLPVYFGNKVITEVVKWIFIVFGIAGFAVESGKTKIGIIGLDDTVLGAMFISVWFALYWFGKHWAFNIIGFVCLLFGVYGFLSGIQKIVYSILKIPHTRKILSKEEKKTDIILFITKIFGLILAIIQIAKAAIDLSMAI